ncbi:MAG: hypothetical protein J6W29_00650 [Neisseriaceae bacterium]|nr:hypothetical protein [Neisseriaceae bacterium]
MKKAMILTAVISAFFAGSAYAKTVQKVDTNSTVSSSSYDTFSKDTVLLCGKLENQYALSGIDEPQKKNEWTILKLPKKLLVEDDDFGNRMDNKIFVVSSTTKSLKNENLKIGNNYMIKGDIFVGFNAYHPENSILLSVKEIFPIDDNSFNRKICFNQF